MSKATDNVTLDGKLVIADIELTTLRFYKPFLFDGGISPDSALRVITDFW